MSAMISCNSNNKTDTKDSSNATFGKEVIPDTVVQFLITSAAKDFNEHQPPTAIDFRNVKAGYIPSDNVMIYLICGEFLSQEKRAWESFTTIKTSGYEQYIGSTTYCQDATFVEIDNNRLSKELRNKLTELRKVNAN